MSLRVHRCFVPTFVSYGVVVDVAVVAGQSRNLFMIGSIAIGHTSLQRALSPY